MKRSVAVLSVLIVLVAACGGGEAIDDTVGLSPSTLAPTTSAGPSSTTEPPTTMASPGSTSTAPSAFTTTSLAPEDPKQRPWRMIPAPDPLAARLTEPFGGPMIIEEVCLEADIGGSFDAPGTLEVLTTMLGFLDVAIVDAGCDASLEVVLSGERIPAQYDFSSGNTRTCYSGLSIEGSVAIEIDGQVTGVHPIEVREAPPDNVDFCQGDEPFSAGSYLGAPLSEIFGMSGLLALAAARDTDLSAHLPKDLDSEDALAAVLSGLYHEDDRVRLVAFLALSGRFTWLDELSQDQIDAVPKLIAALDFYLTTGLDPSPSLSLSLVDALDDLFQALRGAGQLPGGFMQNCPAHWWLLWLDEWELSAPCDHIEVSS